MKRCNEVYSADKYSQYDFTSMLLPEIWQLIFSVALPCLQEIVLVSKKWRDMAYDPDFYKAIVPAQRFGSDAWEKYIGTVEKETCLPYCIFKDMDRGEGFLTWIPESVQIKKEDGTTEEIVLDSASKLENLVQNPKDGNKTDYTKRSLRPVIEEKITTKKSHWVWIEKKPIGHKQCYEMQVEAVEKLSKEEGVTKGANLPSFIDTLITGFMEKIRTGNKCFEYDDLDLLWVRVKDISELKICIGFTKSALEIDRDNRAYPNLAVFVARISYGRSNNNKELNHETSK